MSAVSVQNLTLSFGENVLFQNVSFEVGEKDKVGFVGANGVGKTSLFKILTGEYEATEGGAFLGKNIKLGYMEQHTCSDNKTVYNELISVFDELIQIENELSALADEITKNPSAELIARQDYLTELFNSNGGLFLQSFCIQWHICLYSIRQPTTLISAQLNGLKASFPPFRERLSLSRTTDIFLIK